MAYNVKDTFFLDTQITTGTGAGDGAALLDLSAYIDPIARGKSKAVGLAVYKVHFDVADAGANTPVAASAAGQFRAVLMSNPGIPAAAVGSGAFVNDTLNAANNLVVAGSDYCFGGTAAGDPSQPQQNWLKPSTEVPYVIVRDSVILGISVLVGMGNSAILYCRMECAQITLDQSTLNQLLRTQTV